MSDTSRERFLQQLERCVKHQLETITPPDIPNTAPPDVYESNWEFIPPEEMGNGEEQVGLEWHKCVRIEATGGCLSSSCRILL